MQLGRVLVVDHDVKTRQKAAEVMAVLRLKYQIVGSLFEARDLLAANDYACILLGCEIAASPGGDVCRQNSEHFMDDRPNPPAIVIYHRMEDMTEDDLVCWVADMAHRGVKRFVRRPFCHGGRTLDRALKKVLGLDGCNGTPAPATQPTRDEADREGVRAASPAPSHDRKPSASDPQSTTVGADPPALTKTQREVLDALARSPHQAMLQVEVEAAGGYSKHATRRCLRGLSELGLIHRPQGERGGYAATAKGRETLVGNPALAACKPRAGEPSGG